MADRWFRVKLDIERIRRTLSREDATQHTRDYVLNWLREAGFQRIEDDDAWLVREAELGQVDPSEVKEIQEHPGPS